MKYKGKNKPADKVYTPEPAAKDIINQFDIKGTILDPFRGGGAFYNNYPENVEKDWCEIDEGRDFFDYNKHVDWIISNPPFSEYAKVMKHSYEIADNIVYLIPLSKIGSAISKIKELVKFGGIKSIYFITHWELNWKFAFAYGAVYYKKDYKGPIELKFSQKFTEYINGNFCRIRKK